MSGQTITSGNADAMNHAGQRRRRARAMTCPHCGEALRIRDSRRESPTCRQGFMECTNVACGWRGSFTLTLDRTSVESDMPNPNINLPLSDAARRRLEQVLEADNARRVWAGPGK